PWQEVSEDAEGARFGRGPLASGVYLRVGREGGGARDAGPTLIGLDARGEEAARYGAGHGLVAATRRGEGPPVWVVTGVDEAGLDAAARSLNRDSLHGHYAVVSGPDGQVPLPVR